MTDELHSCGFHCTRPACVEARAREWEAQRRRIAELEAERDEERAIVDRIWDQLGRPSYEELNGRSIYDLIDALKADADRLDWLEMMANERGGILLHDGSETGRLGLGMRYVRSLRAGIDAAKEES